MVAEPFTVLPYDYRVDQNKDYRNIVFTVMEIEKVKELKKAAFCLWHPEKTGSHQCVSVPGKSWERDLERVRNKYFIE
jgi:hypothetical protein